MKTEKKKYRLTGITSLLGSVALDKKIYTNYIATKGKDQKELDMGKEDVENVIDSEEKITGFYRDAETGAIVLKAYQIKGFLKEAAKVLKDQLGLLSCTSKIDNLVFVSPRNIPVMRDGLPVTDPDGFLERPLRADTAQGPRVALAKSEMIHEGWSIDIEIEVLENKKTAKSVNVDMDLVENLLEYGEKKGLLQWRNGGYGSFTFEEICE